MTTAAGDIRNTLKKLHGNQRIVYHVNGSRRLILLMQTS